MLKIIDKMRACMDATSEDVSILFSGGSDSTLAAAYCAQRFRKVHLLTFHHSGMFYLENSKVNVKRLQRKFGRNKFIHKLIDIEECFHKLYFANYFYDLKRYRTFLAAATCNICQLAMHTQTILYNLENDIHFACDGYKEEKRHVYFIMSEEGLALLKNFYDEYKICYENPVYTILRTDWILYDLGIIPKKNVKFPHEKLKYTTQHSCYHGILTNAYILGYYYPLYKTSNKAWAIYFKEKLGQAREYINAKIKKKL